MNTDVLVVSFTDAANLDGYVERNDPRLSLLLDQQRDAYRAFGLERGTIARVYGWRMVRRYAQIFRSDGTKNLRKATDDTLQLGGNFVVDADGILRYGYWSAGPDDRPSVDELVAAASG